MENSTVNEHIWNLIAKCHTGECSHEEKEELDSWLELSNENRELFDDAASLLNDTAHALAVSLLDKDKALQKISDKTDSLKQAKLLKARRVKRINMMLRIAASVILFVSIGTAFFTWRSNTNRFDSITTAVNEIRQVALPDGTMVVLNGGSTMKYPKEFAKKDRKVTLKGEAFFDVTPDKKHPFIIALNNMKVKVLGTSFNVNAYDNSPETSVVVESGLVQVTSGSNSVTVSKGESAILDRKSGILQKRKNSDVNFKAWKTKQIRFVNTSLNDALSTLEKVYRVNIMVDNSSILANKRIDADFDKQTIDFILNTICETYHLNYTKKGDKYMITGKK